MAIYKGDKKIIALYKGDKKIIKRYKGTQVVYDVTNSGGGEDIECSDNTLNITYNGNSIDFIFAKYYSDKETYKADSTNSIDNGDGTYTYSADLTVNAGISYTFENCTNLIRVDCFPSTTSTSKYAMNCFYGCSRLEYANVKDIVTSNMTDISSMFFACQSLKELDLSGWDVSNVTKCKMLFMNCSNLETVNLSGWELNSIGDNYANDYGYMFNGCTSLKKIILGEISQEAYNWWKTKVIDDYGWTNVTIEYTII